MIINYINVNLEYNYNYFIKERINKELYNYIVSLYKDKYGRNNNYLKEDWDIYEKVVRKKFDFHFIWI